MAVIGNTNVSLNDVRTAVGESSYSLFTIGTSALVNKWSRFKPLRSATRPASSDGKYGFNLPTNWNYLQPRGGEPGGLISGYDEPVRLGDFRGYQDDYDIAGPVIWCLSSNVSVPASMTPSAIAPPAGTFTVNMNTAHDDVRILLSDLGYGSYYWCLQVGSYYKTFSTVSNGTYIQFDLQLDLTDPANPTLSGFPVPTLIAPGTVTWRLYICSTAHTSWTSSVPSNLIELPGGTGETYGAKTIVSNGTFTLTYWIATTETSLGWLWNGTTEEHLFVVQSAAKWHLHSKPAGFVIKTAAGVDILEESGEYDSGQEIKIYPSANNTTYVEIAGSFFFHDSYHNECEVEVVQMGQDLPASVSFTDIGADLSFVVAEYIATIANNSNIIILDLQAQYGTLEDTLWPINYRIYRNMVAHGDVSRTAAGSGTMYFISSSTTLDIGIDDCIMTGGGAAAGEYIDLEVNY